MAASSDYERNVFLNCPFDGSYSRMFEAIAFAVFDCGFLLRCALETEDAGQVRMEKIFQIIGECRFGINDLSRTSLDPATGLPRFNMPFELGIFLGARRYGQGRQKEKSCLVLDSEKYRYRAFLSDISGQDIREHADDPLKAIYIVRNWLRNHSQKPGIPGGKVIGERYQAFRNELPEMCREALISEEELIFADYSAFVFQWLRRNQ
jgi:hypothetical protein